MQEALERTFTAAIDSQSYRVNENIRMDQLRPRAQELYEAVHALVLSKNQFSNQFGIYNTIPPIEVTFKHAFAGTDGVNYLDVPVKVHFQRRSQLAFPEQVKPGISIMARFPGMEDAFRVFAFAQDGDMMNNRGKFVNEEELIEATRILSDLGAKVPQPSS